MSRRSFIVALCVLAAVIGALVWLNVQQAQRKTWDVSYAMTNQGIEWTGAGYSLERSRDAEV